MSVEQSGPEAIINHEPDAYARFAYPGVKYLIPLSPSAAQTEVKPPRKFLEGTSLTNMEHVAAHTIPVYTLPEIRILDTGPMRNEEIIRTIKADIEHLSAEVPAFQILDYMLTHEDGFAYRGARVEAQELALKTEEPQLNKLISLATYGLDYPPQNGRGHANVSISINDLSATVPHFRGQTSMDKIPGYETKYSLLMIYDANGLDYVEDAPVDESGKKNPQFYGIKITDDETLRDKLQAVVLIPWADEPKSQA